MLAGKGLCKDKVLHRHVCIALLPNPPIVILELPNCLSHEWLTFLKRCYWLVRQEFPGFTEAFCSKSEWGSTQNVS